MFPSAGPGAVPNRALHPTPAPRARSTGPPHLRQACRLEPSGQFQLLPGPLRTSAADGIEDTAALPMLSFCPLHRFSRTAPSLILPSASRGGANQRGQGGRTRAESMVHGCRPAQRELDRRAPRPQGDVSGTTNTCKSRRRDPNPSSTPSDPVPTPSGPVRTQLDSTGSQGRGLSLADAGGGDRSGPRLGNTARAV